MGKWIMIATLAGDIAPVDMRKLYVKNVRLVGSTLRSKPQEVKAEILKRLVEKVWGKVFRRRNTSGDFRRNADYRGGKGARSVVFGQECGKSRAESM